jgi:hypothetical protein
VSREPSELEPPAVPGDPGTEPAPESNQRTRKSVLKLFGALAVAFAGGAAVRSETADATNGDALLAGGETTASSATTLHASGPIANDGAFVVTADAADWALEGSSGQIGVLGSGYIGVTGTGDVGGFFSGNLAAISLQPQVTTGSPSAGDYSKGDILVDASGVMYLCVADGNPGTWIKVSHGGYRPLATPVRAYDSRTAPGGKLGPGNGDLAAPRPVQITGLVAGVPSNAVAVAGNLTVTQSEGIGFATLWPSGPWPETSNINFVNTDLANAFTVGLGGTGGVNVAASTPTHVIIDVAGYIL